MHIPGAVSMAYNTTETARRALEHHPRQPGVWRVRCVLPVYHKGLGCMVGSKFLRKGAEDRVCSV